MTGRRLNFPDSHPRDPEDGAPIGAPCRPNCPKFQPADPRGHCTVCHNTFASFVYFDGHRDRAGRCLNPASVGQVLDDGLWATRERHERRREFVYRTQTGRRRRRLEDD